MTSDIKLQALNRVLVYLQMQRDIWNLRWVYAKVTDREKAGEAYDKIAKNQSTLKIFTIISIGNAMVPWSGLPTSRLKSSILPLAARIR